MKRINRTYIKFIAGLLIFSLICPGIYAFNPTKAFALSVEEEKRLGKEFVRKIRHHFDLIKDDFCNQYLNELGQYLFRPVETKHFPVHMYLIKDHTLNAFAAPGGNMFIFSGLVKAVDTLDELSAVICHEIGHVSARHLAERIELNKKIALATLAGMIAGALIGGEMAGALATGSMAAGVQAQLHYSREDERQADQLGFKYMAEAGFDPSAMLGVLEKMERGRWFGSDKVPTYLLTHPTGPERMANMDSLLEDFNKINGTKKTRHFRSLFPYFKMTVTARYRDADDAGQELRKELAKAPEAPLPNFGMGLVQIKRMEYAEAVRYLEKALERAERKVPVMTALGEAYMLEGREREARNILKRALKEDADNKAALFVLGLSYEKAGDYSKASDVFERLASLPPVKNDVYYHLGVSYGRQEELANAHYSFALYFGGLGDIEKARFHLKKAGEFPGKSPILGERVKELERELM